ncbi:MAG: hypothetical protein Q9182_005112 [Xanthomendoza sp. 2 TL-2023]
MCIHPDGTQSSARGNTSLESAVSLTKSLRWEIQALGQRLAQAATTDERARSGKLKAQEKSQHELELKRVLQSIKKLLDKIDDAVPMINLAITASGTNLSSNLPTTVSPSRLLQASTFLTAGDSQYSLNPSESVQIGPTFTLSMYMLFAGHIRPQFEEDIRESTWKEVIHKANVRLMRVPLDELYHLPGETSNQRTMDGSTLGSSSPSSTKRLESGYFPAKAMEGGRADEYAYQLLIIEDLDDDRVHTFEDDKPQPGSFGDVHLAGIREAVPIHEVSKIFYADTGKILNIGSDGEINSPILLLKRDINAVPPRRIMERKAAESTHDLLVLSGNGLSDSPSMNGYPHSQSPIARLDRAGTPATATSTPRKGQSIVQAHNPWRIPLDLDPEWIAFEVYTESEDSDVESEPDHSSKRSRTPSVEPSMTTAMSRLQLQLPSSGSTPLSPHPSSARSQSAPQLPHIRTSLSLLETLLRLLSLQQFQQTPHLSIPDELLTFFLSESASTGAASGDIEERKRLRDDARRRVGFDPYDESPIKRRGEEYQYRDQREGVDAINEGYEGQPYTPEHAVNGHGYGTPPSATRRYDRSRSGTPTSGKGLSGTPPVRWRPTNAVDHHGDRMHRSSPLARPGIRFTDEGLGSSPQSNNQTPDVEEQGVKKNGDSEETKNDDEK